MTKILVVDDERELREVASLYLEKEGFKVLQAGDGVTAVKVFHDEKPDLVVLDLMLPDIPGEKVCNVIRENHNTPIIMLTSKSGEDSKISGLEMGADDYMTKPFSPKELVARVKAIFRRAGTSQSPERHTSKRIEIDENLYTVKKEGRAIDLTPIEFKILSTMYRNPGRTYTREQLITYALGYEYEGMSRTIDSHIKNIRQKVETDPSRPEFIRTVFGVGYKYVEEQ
ncbi:MAG TPA: response regulator transcription factor [Clostridia bacterium]|nr:response regulator transcription factor [Clostridia bacterium]HRX41628.1 response regulator transcription factor [Clostridia bacterium]